jgi:DNA-directed RNA polymerase subunit beta
MNKIFVNNLGDLSETQRANFYRFLYRGISEELTSFPNPFFSYVRIFPKKKKVPCFIYLFPSEIKLKGPDLTPEICMKRDISYTIQLYISGEYSYFTFNKELPILSNFNEINNLQTDEEIKLKSMLIEKKNRKFLLNKKDPKYLKKEILIQQDLFFGEIPLMTQEGTFIINGCERIVISQIIRSPGVYFKKEFALSSKKNIQYTAIVISNKGLWTKFILDNYPDSSKKSKEEDFKNRIYVKFNQLSQQSYEGEDIEGREKKRKKLETNKDKIFIFDLLKFYGLNLAEISDSLRYSEYIENQQLENEELDKEENLFLMEKYFLNLYTGGFSIGEIGRYKINKKLKIHLPKDIHYLTSHDLLGIIDGLIELKYFDRTNDDIDDIKNKLVRSVGDLLQNQIRIALYRLQKTLMTPIQFWSKKFSFEFFNEEINPGENKLPIMGDQWILDPRPLTNSFKDFFISSELSQYMDQINPLSELTHKRRISVFGPNGLKRDHISNVIRDIHPSQYGRLCPIETPEGQNAGLINAIALYGRINLLGTIETPYFLMQKGKIFSNKSTIFLNPEQESNTKIAFCDLSISVTKKIDLNYLSIKENSSFSVKKKEEINFMTTSPLQIISLGTALIPFLEHDDANRALMGSNMQRQAVPLLYPKKPIIGTGLESSSILDSGMIVKSYSQGIVEYSSSQVLKIVDTCGQKINYYLKKYLRSNQETCIHQKPIVWLGEKIFSGQIIADGPSTVDGELSLGRNLLVAYMPWEGYNYEDAIIINERLIVEDCLTSIHIEEYETNLTYCLLGHEKLTRKIPHLTKYVRRHLDQQGIVQIGSYVKENDVLVGKLVPYEDTSPEMKLLKTLYPEKFDKKKTYRDRSLRVPSGTEGRVIDIRVSSTVLFNQEDAGINSSEIIRIYIAEIRKIQIGDKLAGRHGNKGIISRILPSIDMPYLPDGTPIDIILNPLGVPSRMNVGQVFECLLGFAGEKLGCRFLVSPFDEIYGKEASRILVNQKLKEAALISNQAWIYNPFYPGKILLRDGRTGEFFDNPITIGRSYILKLIHLVDDKIHTRSTGPYAMITEQPLGGKAQNGGQRFGEMEVWALEAYGCANILQELLTIKSDDMDGRSDMFESILLGNEKPRPSIPEAFLTLMRELNALGLNFSFSKIEPNINKKFEKDIFKDIEKRLKLRALLFRSKTEYLAKVSKDQALKGKIEKKFPNKINQKKKVLEKFNQIQVQKFKNNN